MSEIQEILLKARLSEAGQLPCPQSVFSQLAEKSDEEILTLLKDNSQWIWWLFDNNIATARKLAEYGLIQTADNETGEINEGIWYVPENVTVTMNGGQCLCPEAGAHVTVNGGQCWCPQAGAIIIDNRKGGEK